MLETLAESMVYVTTQQMVGYANVTQGLLVITALLVRNNQKKRKKKKKKKKIKKIFQKYVSTMLFKYKQIE